MPGERGPRLVPSTASSASAPFRSGRLKRSSSRSCTHIAPIRSSSRMWRRPSRRMRQSRPNSAHASRQESVPSRGGVSFSTGCRARAKRFKSACQSASAAASAAQCSASAVSPPGPNARWRASRDKATVGRACAANLSPCASSPSSRISGGGMRCSRCAHAETWNPGANSRVTAAPPRRSPASSTSTRRPPRAR